MCSEVKMNTDFRQTQDWQMSDRETDEQESVEFFKEKCKSLPCDVRGAVKTTAFHKSNSERTTRRSSGFSLEDRMRDWHRCSVIDKKAEREAEKYTEMVKDDTLKHLHKSIVLAGSMVGSGSDINEELRRQERVLRKADADMSYAEYETDQASQTLRAMTSLAGKFWSNIRRKNPKLNLQTWNDCDLLNGEVGLSSLSRTCTGSSAPPFKGSPKDEKERQIQAGMGDLHSALDFITMQQMDAAWTLNRQKGHLRVFEKKVDRTHTKMKRQNQVMNSVMGKY